MDPRYACPDLVFILETCAVALCDEFVMNDFEFASCAWQRVRESKPE
jgi:hypothetical protein